MNQDRTTAENESAVGAALDRVFRASQRVVIDRIDLILLEMQQSFARSFLGVIGLVVASGLILGGWWGLMALIVLVGGPDVRPLLIGVIGVVNLVIGAAIIGLAASHVKVPKVILSPPETAPTSRAAPAPAAMRR